MYTRLRFAIPLLLLTFVAQVSSYAATEEEASSEPATLSIIYDRLDQENLDLLTKWIGEGFGDIGFDDEVEFAYVPLAEAGIPTFLNSNAILLVTQSDQGLGLAYNFINTHKAEPLMMTLDIRDPAAAFDISVFPPKADVFDTTWDTKTLKDTILTFIASELAFIITSDCGCSYSEEDLDSTL